MFRPALVYFDRLNSYAGYIAETAAHEMGHNLALTHDGTATMWIPRDMGSREDWWGPISGRSIFSVSQWSKGEYYNANNPQDDLAVLDGFLGYADDDHADTNNGATTLDVSGSGFTRNGVISAPGDADRFAITVPTKAVRIEASPFRASDGTAGGNAHLRLEIFNSANALVLEETDRMHVRGRQQWIRTRCRHLLHPRHSRGHGGRPCPILPRDTRTMADLGQFTLYGTLTDAVLPSVQTQPID